MATNQYKKEEEALKLLYPNWDKMDMNERRAKHHMFLFYIDAAIETNIVEFKEN